MKDVRENVAEIVARSFVLSFACVDGESDQPYQVWLHYAGDLQRVIVYSRRDRVHSDYVRKNDKVSVAILPEQIPGGPIRGLSGQGTIRELTDEAEIAAATKTYEAKFNKKDGIDQQTRSGKPDDHALWEITMTNYVLFDMHNYPDDPRKELEI